jgi:hypothetical protein
MSSVRLLAWPLVLLCAVLVLLVLPAAAAAATATGAAQSATGLDLAGLAILSPLNHSVVPAPNVRLQLDVMVFSAAGPDLERVMRSALHYQVDGLPAVKCTECWELPWVPLYGLEPHDHCVAGEGGGGTTGIARISKTAVATFAVAGKVPAHSPFLFETAPAPEARFVPTGDLQIRSSIYTLWNVLDRLMERHEPEYVPKYGYMRRSQLDYFLGLGSKPGFAPKVYCETGFNAGHSAVAMLAAFPDMTVHSFDLGALKYSQPAADLIEMTFPGRFFIHWGYSRDSIPAFHTSQPALKADVFLVDGAHDAENALLDAVNFHKMAACRHTLVFDDSWPVGDDSTGVGHGDGGPGRAIIRAVETGVVAHVDTLKHTTPDDSSPPLRWKKRKNGRPSFTTWIDANWGWSIGQFNLPCREPLDELTFGRVKAEAAVGEQQQQPAAAQEPLVLSVEGVGSMTVPVGQEPADIVQEFVRQAADAGVAIDAPTAERCMQFFCERTVCAKHLVL